MGASFYLYLLHASKYAHLIRLLPLSRRRCIIGWGVCYGEIGWWNKGIVVFAEALNRYKRGKNVVKYAECMNNLGTLYLQASSLSLAEKCFIQSYNLKKSLHGKSNTKLLTSLFNIFECNLLTKNYDQA